jgi:hypothetical protein
LVIASIVFLFTKEEEEEEVFLFLLLKEVFFTALPIRSVKLT